MGKARRVLILLHPQFDPRRGREKAATEFDVLRALRGLGHEVEIAPAEFDLRRFDKQLARFTPDIVFNLLEEFRGEGVYDFHLITYLESLGVPFTGCNPRGLVVTRNKLWSAHIACGEGIAAPGSRLAPGAGSLRFPLLVKYNREHASLAITRANVVRDRRQLGGAIARLGQRYDGEVLMQEFIPGHEVSVGVWGNKRVDSFAPWRLHLGGENEIATARVKFSARYRRERGIRARRWAGVPRSMSRGLQESAVRLFRLLDMNGYARLDFRVDGEGRPFVIDVNANPCLAKTEDFAAAARHEGIEYPDLIRRILDLGLSYRPRH